MTPDDFNHAERFVVAHEGGEGHCRETFESLLQATVRYTTLVTLPETHFAKIEVIGIVDNQTAYMVLEEWRKEPPESLLTAAHAVLAAMQEPAKDDRGPYEAIELYCVPWGVLKALQDAVVREEKKEANRD